MKRFKKNNNILRNTSSLMKKIIFYFVLPSILFACTPPPAPEPPKNLIEVGELEEIPELSAEDQEEDREWIEDCLLYTSPSPRDQRGSRMPSSA